MPTNKSPFLKSDSGALNPKVVLLPVQAGATQAIKAGEICQYGKVAGYAAPVDAATDTTMLVVAQKEQKSDDVERMLPFIVPRPDDMFEFALSANRAVELGETFAISDSQTLAYATSNVVFRIADDCNQPEPEEESTTARTVSHARGYFDEQASYLAALTGNS